MITFCQSLNDGFPKNLISNPNRCASPCSVQHKTQIVFTQVQNQAQSELIPLKFKHDVYRGHYMYGYVSSQKIFEVLR